MTTIIAIEGRDGVVFCADLQATTDLTKEIANKIRAIRPNEMLGCAGSTEYIDVFYQHVVDTLTKSERPDYLRAMNQAIDSYCEYVAQRIEKLRLDRIPIFYQPRNYYPQGIFVVYDKNEMKHRLFEIQTPDPCVEVSEFQQRVATGSGGVAATVILKTFENIIGTWPSPYRLQWKDFSTKFIGQMCWILLRRISELDAFTSGFAFYELSANGNRGINYEELFPEPGIGKQLPQLVQTALREVPPNTVAAIVGSSGLMEVMRGLGL